MSNYKVVRNANEEAVCYGPNDNNYEPVVGVGCKLSIEEFIPSKTPAELQLEAISHFATFTTSYIDKKIQAYNVANGVAFADIDAFTKYAVVAASAHNAIAIKFITYADNIWKAARAYQATATVIPTDPVFTAELDKVVF